MGKEACALLTHSWGIEIFVIESFEDGVCGQHAALHGIVGALDFGDVHEASTAARHETARERQLWDTLRRENENNSEI